MLKELTEYSVLENIGCTSSVENMPVRYARVGCSHDIELLSIKEVMIEKERDWESEEEK